MAAAILDFCTIAITQPPIDVDWWNFAVYVVGCYQK